jgi:hypothetical protein
VLCNSLTCTDGPHEKKFHRNSNLDDSLDETVRYG